MVVMCGTRIRYIRHLVYLIGSDLVGGIEESGHSSGHRFPKMVYLVQSAPVIDLMLQDSDQFKSSVATTSALGRWSLGTSERSLPGG
jgi:hypothetical protein